MRTCCFNSGNAAVLNSHRPHFITFDAGAPGSLFTGAPAPAPWLDLRLLALFIVRRSAFLFGWACRRWILTSFAVGARNRQILHL